MAATLVAVLIPTLARRPRRRRQQHRHDSGPRCRHSGAVLPGVTVTASSPSMIGTQTQVTNENGSYRFPAVPPGVYTLTFELAGFNTVRRDGIEISLGLHGECERRADVATLQETVTVTGDSPVIDTTATRVQQNFKLEQLNSIPNGRDMWALLAATPGVVMSRIDVGGNRAGTQTGYTAYGLNGQVRTSVEGINTTEGTDGAGFYYDYGSFEEVFLGVAGQGAEAATPGVQSKFLGKSGSNRFSGEFYVDGYNNSFQGSNLSEHLHAADGSRAATVSARAAMKCCATTTSMSTPADRSSRTRPGSISRGDVSSTPSNSRCSSSIESFDTWNQNPSAKVTYQLNQNNKFIGYYQWNMKDQPNASADRRLHLDRSVGDHRAQESPSWV